MPLPKISTPTYELELPSTGETIKYRPFLVKEEKLLVLALESEDMKQITTAIKSVIKSCIQSKSIKVENLPTFDIEYLFLNIRGKSVGEEIEVNLIAPDDGETPVEVKILIDDIKSNILHEEIAYSKHNNIVYEILKLIEKFSDSDYIIFLDINMPEMDGLTLLSKLNEIRPLLRSVMVSAYGDMDNIRTAMNRGAFDFITKPINFEDLSITMEKTLKHSRQIKETLKAIKENNILK